MEVLEVKNTVTERKIDQKNSVVDFNKHLKTNKQTKNSELKDKLIQIMPSEEQKEKKMEMNSLREMWDTIKYVYICLMEVP